METLKSTNLKINIKVSSSILQLFPISLMEFILVNTK